MNYKIFALLKNERNAVFFTERESDVFHMKVKFSSKIFNFPENEKVFFLPTEKVFLKFVGKKDKFVSMGIGFYLYM